MTNKVAGISDLVDQSNNWSSINRIQSCLSKIIFTISIKVLNTHKIKAIRTWITHKLIRKISIGIN